MELTENQLVDLVMTAYHRGKKEGLLEAKEIAKDICKRSAGSDSPAKKETGK